MSKLHQIQSKPQFQELLSSHASVVADFYADWCGPCKAIAPVFEQAAQKASQPNRVAFAKINVDQQPELAQSYGVSAMPTFIIFRNGQVKETIQGANASALKKAFAGLTASSSEDTASWVAFPPTRSYQNVTSEVDPRGLDMLNGSKEYGSARTLFESSKPSSLQGKSANSPDWVESDTDEQMMLFIPFKTTLKIQSVQITSAVPSESDRSMRPQTLKLFINQPNVLSFEEADSIEATQVVEIDPQQWDSASQTANVDLRFVKFQRVHSLVIFVLEGQREDGVEHVERTRIDRLRFVGESGEKHEMGKLERVDH